MEIQAQEVIDAIASKYAGIEASRIKEIVLLEAQVKYLESENRDLKNKNSNLSDEVQRLSDHNIEDSSQVIEGDLIG